MSVISVVLFKFCFISNQNRKQKEAGQQRHNTVEINIYNNNIIYSNFDTHNKSEFGCSFIGLSCSNCTT